MIPAKIDTFLSQKAKGFNFTARNPILEQDEENHRTLDQAKKKKLTPEENLAKITRLQRRNSMTTFEHSRSSA